MDTENGYEYEPISERMEREAKKNLADLELGNVLDVKIANLQSDLSEAHSVIERAMAAFYTAKGDVSAEMFKILADYIENDQAQQRGASD